MSQNNVETVYTSKEVAKHNTINSLWVMTRNKAYDVTEFLDKHLGGKEVLIEHPGLDATEYFEEIGHSSEAEEMMKEYRIAKNFPTKEENKEKIVKLMEQSRGRKHLKILVQHCSNDCFASLDNFPNILR
jgi:cytochrome b involved in lipid metabolism